MKRDLTFFKREHIKVDIKKMVLLIMGYRKHLGPH